jgi:flavin reductase (DIM6/NTAB) family NADH-FMN oxidoreductase RutF
MDVGRIAESVNAALVVVTAAHNGERSGCLVGFHSQCSIDPVRYAVWISRLNHTYPIATRSDHLGLHFLDESDHDLASTFGGMSGDDVDKFAGVEWSVGDFDVPILTNCKTVVIATRVTCLDDGGDHVGIVCEPVASAVERFRPLRLLDVQDITPGHPSS